MFDNLFDKSYRGVDRHNALRAVGAIRVTITEPSPDCLLEFVRDISNMPTEYFEAKPQRAVLFNEVAAVVLPENGTEDLQASLADLGVTVVKYTNGDEDSRHVAVNSVDGVRFSKKRSRYNEYETLVMRWNNSAETNIGDCKVFSTGKKGVFTLMEALTAVQ